MVKVREFIHENPLTDSEKEMLMDSRADAAEIKRLREALAFYAKEWRMNAEGDFSTRGLSRSWMEPTDALWDDAGRKAHEALQPSRDSVAKEGA